MELLTHHLLFLPAPLMDHRLLTHPLVGMEERRYLWGGCLGLGGWLPSQHRLTGLHRNWDRSWLLSFMILSAELQWFYLPQGVLQSHRSWSTTEAENVSDKGIRWSVNICKSTTYTLGEQEKYVLGFLLGQGKFPSQGACSANSSHSWQRPPPVKAWPVSDVPEDPSTPRGQGGLWREVVTTVCLIFSQITQKIIN